jgi:hypothetical protein
VSDAQARFEVCDLLDVGRRLHDERFDICLFKGIFYHLPDPVTGLKIVADRTDEVLIVDTAAATGRDDGYLQLGREGSENPMSGVHGLAWYPTGPQVVADILVWLGFSATCVMYWRQPDVSIRRFGRLRVVGARDESRLAELTLPPCAAIISPSDAEQLSGGCTIVADALGAVVDVTKVEVSFTGSNCGGHIADATRTWTGWIAEWDTTKVPNGIYRLRSLAFDYAGRPGREASTSVEVRN